MTLSDHCVKDIRDFDFVLNNHSWKVRFLKSSSPLVESINGVCDSNEYMIAISSTIEGTIVMTTLFHEIQHAILCGIARSSGTLDEEHVAELNGLAWPIIWSQLPLWVKKECEQIFESFVKTVSKKGKKNGNNTRGRTKRVRKEGKRVAKVEQVDGTT